MRWTGGQQLLLEVARQAPFGYFLTDGEQDVLLHASEVVGNVAVGDRVTVYLYHDAEDRLAATMRKLRLTQGETGRLEVADVNRSLGVFLEIGIGRQLLLPKSDLPEERALWPQPGDVLYVRMESDKQGRMLARLAKETDLLPLMQAAGSEWRNREENGYVYNVLKIGAFLITDAMHLGLLHRAEMAAPVRLGQALRARVTFVREDGRVNFSTRPRKQEGRMEDAERIYDYLCARGGSMPYSDVTPPDIIQAKFGLSKAAFKRALGKLMKEGRIVQEDGWTRRKEQG